MHTPLAVPNKSAASSRHALTTVTASASMPSVSFTRPTSSEPKMEPDEQPKNFHAAFPPKIEAYMRKQSPMLLETYRLFQALDDQGVDDHKVPCTDIESFQAACQDY
jgi:hypothetical protein